jgi:hypothetical protein
MIVSLRWSLRFIVKSRARSPGAPGCPTPARRTTSLLVFTPLFGLNVEPEDDELIDEGRNLREVYEKIDDWVDSRREATGWKGITSDIFFSGGLNVNSLWSN